MLNLRLSVDPRLNMQSGLPVLTNVNVGNDLPIVGPVYFLSARGGNFELSTANGNARRLWHKALTGLVLPLVRDRLRVICFSSSQRTHSRTYAGI